MQNHHQREGALLALVAVGAIGLACAVILDRPNSRANRVGSAPARTARHVDFGRYAVTGRTVTISRPRSELYAFWRDFANLPRFMENVKSIKPAGEGRSRWTVKGPFDRPVTLETEISEDRPDELIAWQSVGGSDIDAKGRVTFRDGPAGRGTLVEAIIAYQPPAGDLGRHIAKLFGREPGVQARRELKRFKMLMETGEIADARFHHAQS
jgi:uncharacterized membrane protein